MRWPNYRGVGRLADASQEQTNRRGSGSRLPVKLYGVVMFSDFVAAGSCDEIVFSAPRATWTPRPPPPRSWREFTCANYPQAIVHGSDTERRNENRWLVLLALGHDDLARAVHNNGDGIEARRARSLLRLPPRCLTHGAQQGVEHEGVLKHVVFDPRHGLLRSLLHTQARSSVDTLICPPVHGGGGWPICDMGLI